MINFLKNSSLRKFWFLKLILNKKKTFLYQSGWIKSFAEKRPVDLQGNIKPWLSLSAVYFLEERLIPSIKIFEYGAGNSSIYFSKRVDKVISVEHDKQWFDNIQSTINNSGSSVLHFPLGVDYVQSIGLSGGQFDIVLVDGRQRNECTIFSVDYLSSSGVLILDDSERERYLPAIDFLKEKGFKEIKFWGFNLGSVELKATSIFYKENNCLGI